MKYYDSLYLDKEKDIVIDFYIENNDYFYILKTPHHSSGNLITNLAKLCNLEISRDENGLKIVKGKIPSFLNDQNERIFILKFSDKTIAVINSYGKIMRRATINAIAKTLMSQTKEYKLTLSQTFVRTYIEEEYKFKTDVHTHMNACLYPSMLVALGIYHQIRYPYYYVLKLGLKLTKKQEESLLKQREKVSKLFVDSELVGKYKERRINDNTFINFADLILNNIENSTYNIEQILNSLVIYKDGQAVFTNLEKLFLYRYVFTKGVESKKKIKIHNIEKIHDKDVKNYLNRMLCDQNDDNYRNNTLLEDKLLWISRMYQRQGIKYVEISNTTLVKNNDEPLQFLEQAHRILPLAEKETGVTLRFLAALRRIPLTIVKDNVTPDNYLRENLDVLKAVALDPYVIGCDFVGEEINSITELKPVIKEIVDYCKTNPYFTIRIHAGENDAVINNVGDSIKIVKESLSDGQKMPILRLGHGLYTPSLKTTKGKKLLKDIKDNNVCLEFQLTSNVRLNNLNDLENHPLKEYLKNNIMCLQGSDGCGIYGTDCYDEELALVNLLGLTRQEINQMIDSENRVLTVVNKAYKYRCEKFNKLRKNRTISETIKDEIVKNQKESKALSLNVIDKYQSIEVLAKQIKSFPKDKTPIVLAGGSFNINSPKLMDFEKKVIDELLSKLSDKKYYFVIGHKLNGYEKYLLDHKGNFEVYAIVPSDIDKTEKNRLIKSNIPLNISTESIGFGIYKSFNYWIFERIPSIVIGIDGNSAGANLIQEAKNGKQKALIFVSNNSLVLKQKALSLKGYVHIYKDEKDIKEMIKLIKQYN